MRDDQRERYARHIALPEIGEAGQAAILAAGANITGSGRADQIARSYLAAAGAAIDADGREVAIPARPAWWPAAAGDDESLAWWRGAIAATRWLDDAIRG